MYGTDIAWRPNAATTAHTRLDDHSDYNIAIAELANWLDDRGSKLINTTRTEGPTFSWDIADKDSGTIVGAAAVAPLD